MVAEFYVWTSTLGAQIAPAALVQAAMDLPGVVGVDGPAFTFTDLTPTQFATLGDLTIDVVETPDVCSLAAPEPNATRR